MYNQILALLYTLIINENPTNNKNMVTNITFSVNRIIKSFFDGIPIVIFRNQKDKIINVERA